MLGDLLGTLRGSTGALLIEADGEAVVWRSPRNPDQLRLRGAYVAVVLRACEALTTNLTLGAVDHFFLSYSGAGFLAQSVGGGYFLVVELDSSSNLSEAIYRIKPFAVRVREELSR